MTRMLSVPSTFLFDQDCGLCVASAAWLRRRVPAKRLRVIAIGDAAADPVVGPLLAQPPLAGRDLAAVLHVIDADGRVHTGAGAVLAAARHVPRWRWLAMPFDNRLGRVALQPGYRWLASHRREVGRRLGLPATCSTPAASRTR